MLIKLMDARRGLHNKCIELFADKKIAEDIYRNLCDGIDECETIEPKRGLWKILYTPEVDIHGKPISTFVECKCSECGYINRLLTPYCPDCGSRMVESEE